MHTQRAQNYLLHFLNDCAHQRLTSENCQLHFVHITQDLQRSHRICTHHTRFAHTTKLPASFSQRLCASMTDQWKLSTPLCTHHTGSTEITQDLYTSHRIYRDHTGFVHITQDLQRSHRICTHHTRFAHTTLDLHRSHTISSASNRTRFVHIT